MPNSNDKNSPDIEASTQIAAVDNIVSTKHKFKIGSKSISYTATTGTLILKEETNCYTV